MPVGREIELGPRQIVLNGDPAPPFPPPKRGTPILAHVCRGKTAGWIKMLLGMEVHLAPSQSVLYGDPAPPIGTTLP